MDIDNVEAGMKVKYLGCSEAQAHWGNGDDPRKHLVGGQMYEISSIDIHSYHTRVCLKGFPNLWFNSVCFE